MSINTPQYERHAGHGHDLVEVCGSFVTNGSSAPTVIRGKGFTVSAPSTGVYSITIDRAYPEMVCCVTGFSNGDTTATNDEAQVGTYTASTGVLTLITESAAGTAANLTGPVVHFIAKFVKYGTQKQG